MTSQTTADLIDLFGELSLLFLKETRQGRRRRIYQQMVQVAAPIFRDKKVLTSVQDRISLCLTRFAKMC